MPSWRQRGGGGGQAEKDAAVVKALAGSQGRGTFSTRRAKKAFKTSKKRHAMAQVGAETEGGEENEVENVVS